MRARVLLAGAALWLGACDAVVQVDATANVPARYSSVRVTVEEVWLNKSAAATPDDVTWEKHRLDEPHTLELVGLNGGVLETVVSNMVVPAGTYRQMRVVLADTHGRLRDSADDLDAGHNNEVSGIDEDGEAFRVPLEVLNPAQGLGLAIDLKVVEAISAAGGNSTVGRVVVKFDAGRDLVEFRYGDRTGFLLNATPEAADAGEAGTIRGNVNLSRLPVAARPGIEVTAQKLDRATGRRVVVGSASVSRTGAFTLHPLPIDADERVTGYDLVIQGPAIQTVIIREVPVSSSARLSAVSPALLVLEPAESFEANLDPAHAVEPRGARVGFYQTLPGEDAPHLIRLATVDPLSGRFAEPLQLSRASTLLHATHDRDTTLRAVTPKEGAARFAVAAWSVQHGHGAFAANTLRPASATSDTATFTVPAVEVAAPAVPGILSTTVTVATPARYDRGVLIATRAGSVVTLAALDVMLQQSVGSAFVEVGPVPAGTVTATLDAGVYHLEAWTWNSADPKDTFTRHIGVEAVDLRSASSAAAVLAVR